MDSSSWPALSAARDDSDAVTAAARDIGMRSSAGAPISVEGRLWGVMIATSVRENALPSGTEQRLAAFTELIATTIANTQARQELHRVADEQAALRRVATLVAQGASPSALFQAVTVEAGLLLPADATVLSRYDPDGFLTRVGRWSRPGVDLPAGERGDHSAGATPGQPDAVFRRLTPTVPTAARASPPARPTAEQACR
jgi:GAF domain-containing protein